MAAAWVAGDVQELRQKVLSYESRCEGDEALTALLGQARQQLDERSTLLNELSALEKNVTSMTHCQERLARLATLREAYPAGERLLGEAEARLRDSLARLQAEQRARAERWLAQFDVALNGELTAKKAGELLHRLKERPAGLEEQDEPFLERVSERLKLMLDQDVAARIIAEFRTLQTPEQRFECLRQMAELCRADGLPEALSSRLAEILEMGPLYECQADARCIRRE